MNSFTFTKYGYFPTLMHSSDGDDKDQEINNVEPFNNCLKYMQERRQAHKQFIERISGLKFKYGKLNPEQKGNDQVGLLIVSNIPVNGREIQHCVPNVMGIGGHKICIFS